MYENLQIHKTQIIYNETDAKSNVSWLVFYLVV